MDRDGRTGQADGFPGRQHPLRRLAARRLRSRSLRKGVPDEAYKPLSGDDKETAKHSRREIRRRRAGQGTLDFGIGGGQPPAPPPLAETTRAILALPEDSVEEIAEKKKRLAAAQG